MLKYQTSLGLPDGRYSTASLADADKKPPVFQKSMSEAVI